MRQRQPDPAYRPCVGIALFNDKGLVFVGRRAGLARGKDAYAWQMPQGGLDPGEDAVAAARRELHEETGISAITLLMEAPDWLAYDLPEDARRASWGGRYKGQTQKWFAFRFTGSDHDINVLKPPGGHRPEFDQWRWERLDATPALIVPFKRGVYDEVVKTFAGFTS